MSTDAYRNTAQPNHKEETLRRSRRTTRWVAAATSVLAAVGLVCTQTVAVAQTVQISAASKPLIVAFTYANSQSYWSGWDKELLAYASTAGFTIKDITNPFDQSTEDSEVQDWLASGQKPAAYIYIPDDAKSGLTSLVRLYDTGVPVFTANQYVTGAAEKYWVAYAGTLDIPRAMGVGKALGQAFPGIEKAHPAIGKNVIVVTGPPGNSSSINEDAGFVQGLAGSGLKVIANVNSTGFEPSDTFATMQQLITKYKSQGIGVVFSLNSDMAAGVLEALQQAGYQPGKNVLVLDGSCTGHFSDLRSGLIWGTAFQAPSIEAQTTLMVIQRYFATGKKVLPGTAYLPSGSSIPTLTGAIHKVNVMPAPFVLGTQINAAKVWGVPFTQGCSA
jgi:ribose transport system substrate-binding protein